MDTELVTAAARGDEGAFASLAVAAGGRLHAVAYRILRDTNLAEDATARAFWSITTYETSCDGCAGYDVENPSSAT